MTHDRALIFAALFCASPVQPQEGQTWITDAFGLIPAHVHSTSSRANWSGLREALEPSGLATSDTHRAATSDTLLLRVGPKSNIAGEAKIDVMALGFDRYGNLAQGGEPVTLYHSLTETHRTSLQNGLAEHLFRATPVTGTYKAWAKTQERQSARATYRVVPNLAEMAPAPVPQVDPLSSETNHELTVAGLSDAYGNAAGHGVALPIMLRHAQGNHSFFTAVSTGTTATAPFLPRGLSGPAKMSATLGQARPPEATLRIVALQPLTVPGLTAKALPHIGAIHLTIGPFRTTLGHHLYDGAEVRAQFRMARGIEHITKAHLRDGWIDILLPADHTALPARITLYSALGQMYLTLTEDDLRSGHDAP
jgi:hypothetical protein